MLLLSVALQLPFFSVSYPCVCVILDFVLLCPLEENLSRFTTYPLSLKK